MKARCSMRGVSLCIKPSGASIPLIAVTVPCLRRITGTSNLEHNIQIRNEVIHPCRTAQGRPCPTRSGAHLGTNMLERLLRPVTWSSCGPIKPGLASSISFETAVRHRYKIRMAMVDLHHPPVWWRKQAREHMTAAEACAFAGTDGTHVCKASGQ